MTSLAEWLRERRSSIVRKQEVLEPQWDPTYGARDPRTVEIELVDFDQLMVEIEAFELSFKGKK